MCSELRKEYLGFKLRNNMFSVDTPKVKGDKAWETTVCNCYVQSLLAMINIYRGVIKDCDKIAKPVAELTKKRSSSVE